jgi:hypothetical protein
MSTTPAMPKQATRRTPSAGCAADLIRMFHELMSRDRADRRATGQSSHGTAGLVPRRT